MSRKDEIAEDLFNKYALDGDYTVLHDYKYLFKKAMQEHTNQTLQELKEKVIKQLEDLGIPNMVSKKELYDVMDVSTPQEIGEIKAKLEFLDLIDEAIND